LWDQHGALCDRKDQKPTNQTYNQRQQGERIKVQGMLGGTGAVVKLREVPEPLRGDFY
jgi:hypothetical protein